jgi:2-hydroxychromene-2-carboxylate isomerase
MGKVIRLADWANRRGAIANRLPARPDAPVSGGFGAPGCLAGGQVQFAFDLACPLSYLAAEQVERHLGQVEWIPAWAQLVPGASPDDPRDFEAIRVQAQRGALGQHVPLVWPERYPEPVLRAMRAACHAAEVGFGARFGLAALRLAFCGGFDLDEDRILAEAAAAAGVGVGETLAAAEDRALDEVLRGSAEALAAVGVTELPAIRVGPRVFRSAQAVAQAAALMTLRPA